MFAWPHRLLEMSTLLHAPAALSPGTHCTEGWVDRRAGRVRRQSLYRLRCRGLFTRVSFCERLRKLLCVEDEERRAVTGVGYRVGSYRGNVCCLVARWQLPTANLAAAGLIHLACLDAELWCAVSF
jgi:hypothetical protein